MQNPCQLQKYDILAELEREYLAFHLIFLHLQQHMKRRIYILLFQLVGLLILTHAIVPHHHHDKALVVIGTLYDNDLHDHEEGLCNHHKSDAPEHGHEDQCTVVESWTSTSAHISSYWLVSTSNNNYTSYISSLLNPLKVNVEAIQPDTYTEKPWKDILQQHKPLRAPPAC